MQRPASADIYKGNILPTFARISIFLTTALFSPALCAAALSDTESASNGQNTPGTWVRAPYLVYNSSLRDLDSRHAKSPGEILFLEGRETGHDMILMCLYSSYSERSVPFILISYDDVPAKDKLSTYFNGDGEARFRNVSAKGNFDGENMKLGSLRVHYRLGMLTPEPSERRTIYNLYKSPIRQQSVEIDVKGKVGDVILDLPAANDAYMEWGGECGLGRNRVSRR